MVKLTIKLDTLMGLSILFALLALKSLYREVDSGPKQRPRYDLEVKKLKAMGFNSPEVVAAQALHETKNFTSRIYRSSHNKYGMKNNKRHLCVSLKDRPAATDRLHCYYEKDSHSDLDYLEWQKIRLSTWVACGNKLPSNTEEYLTFLDGYPLSSYRCDVLYSYATHTDRFGNKVYTKLLRKYIQKYDSWVY